MIDVKEDGLEVQQGSAYGSYQAYSFKFPFDPAEPISWTYHFEEDHEIRYEIIDDIDELVGPTFGAGRHDDHPVISMVRELILNDWIDTDGSDLMIMDGDGRPLELAARLGWDTDTVGSVTRPYRPADDIPTRARLHPDGRLVFSWVLTYMLVTAAGVVTRALTGALLGCLLN